MGIETYLDIGMSYIKIGTSWTRDLIDKIISFTGFSGRLGTMILMMIVSLLLARILIKGMVTRPFSSPYLLKTAIITLLIFILLMYL